MGTPALLAVSLALITALSAGCTNASLTGIRAPKRGGAVGGSLDSVGGGGASSSIVVTEVVRAVLNPDQQIDLLGDGSGEFGKTCKPVGTAGATTCNCILSYKLPGTEILEEIPVETLYTEEDLVRCSTVSVPSNVASFEVQLSVTTTSERSEAKTFARVGTGLGLDQASVATYREAKRYQCRDAIFIPYPLDQQRMYDPLLSDDPEFTLPLDFYATNKGSALASFVSLGLATPTGSGGGFLCPHGEVPLGANDTVETAPPFGTDLTLFSEGPDSSGSRVIHGPVTPPAGASFDRSTFFLARGATGDFTIPVNAFVAPNTLTSTAGAPNPPPIGFGVAPRSAGEGREVCPAVAKPPGFKFVKLWLFRSSMQDRKFPSSAQIVSMGTVSCNPGLIETNRQIFPDCGAGGAIASSNGGVFADRVVGDGHCFRVQPSASSGVAFTTNGATQKPGFEGFGAGTDIWLHLTGDPTRSCGANLSPIFMNACPASGALTILHDVNPPAASIDGSVGRFDFVFVVSPADVMSGDMKGGNLGKKQAFTPIRFPPGVCDASNPGSPGNCPSAKEINYDVKFHDMSTLGDAPVGDPGRTPAFPTCVLQPE